jgi:hypothetical protein
VAAHLGVAEESRVGLLFTIAVRVATQNVPFKGPVPMKMGASSPRASAFGFISVYR